MKMTVAQYTADFVAERMTQVFSVVGGGSMFMNDAFGHHPKLSVLYNHHEQACTMAAEAYFKQSGVPATVCVTTGPGGTNTVTGLLGAYQDSIPIMMISGQVRYATTVESTGLKLRQFGGQEHQIIDTVRNLTKYAEMVRKPEEIAYILEKAYFTLMDGRRGPVWVDIPLDIQNTEIETEELVHFTPDAMNFNDEKYAKIIVEELKKASRPVFVVGSAVRTSGSIDEFLALVDKWDIPVVYPLNVPDAISVDNKRAYGCFGGVGNRAANFIVQNADLLVVFGCRMAFAHIGFNYQAFSPNSKKIVIDIDAEEQEKPTMKRDIKVVADVKNIISSMLNIDKGNMDISKWIEYCDWLKEKFPIYQDYHRTSKNNVNPYFMAKLIFDNIPQNGTTVIGNSSGLDPLLQIGVREKGIRTILNCNCGSMGYCLPAGIGACVASGKKTIVYTGDGCIQMNLQELETIVFNKLPIKIIVLNNSGYGGVVATQNNFFNGRHSGCTKESGIGIPSFERLAYAYEMTYFKASNNDEAEALFDKFLDGDEPALLEVIQDTKQDIEPCVASRINEEGKIVSNGIDDMSPLLTIEEYEACKYDNWLKS